MALAELKNIVRNFSREEQLELAIYLLTAVQKTDEEREFWFTETVENELLRRKEASIKNPELSLSYDDVMTTIR